MTPTHAKGKAMKPLALAALLALAGCATAPGVADSISRTVTLEAPAATSLSNFYEGMRTTTQYGAPVCAPTRPDGRTVCDVHLVTGFPQTIHPHLIGRVEFAPDGARSSMTMRIVESESRGRDAEVFAAWERFAKTGAGG